MGPNNSFKPNLFRYGKSAATKACHAFASTTQVGLIQALGPMADFEKVVELTDYYDGPRGGVANFLGQPHSFKSRMLDVHGADNAVDLFDLTPVGAPAPTVVARADFRRIGTAPLPSGEWPVLEVRWFPEATDGA